MTNVIPYHDKLSSSWSLVGQLNNDLHTKKVWDIPKLFLLSPFCYTQSRTVLLYYEYNSIVMVYIEQDVIIHV